MQSNGIAQYFKRFPSCEAAKRGFAAPRMSGRGAAEMDSPRSGSDAESEPAGTPRATSPDEVWCISCGALLDDSSPNLP